MDNNKGIPLDGYSVKATLVFHYLGTAAFASSTKKAVKLRTVLTALHKSTKAAQLINLWPSDPASMATEAIANPECTWVQKAMDYEG